MRSLESSSRCRREDRAPNGDRTSCGRSRLHLLDPHIWSSTHERHPPPSATTLELFAKPRRSARRYCVRINTFADCVSLPTLADGMIVVPAGGVFA